MLKTFQYRADKNKVKHLLEMSLQRQSWSIFTIHYEKTSNTYFVSQKVE